MAGPHITWFTWPARVSDVQLVKVVLAEIGKIDDSGDASVVYRVLSTLLGEQTEATLDDGAQQRARPSPFDLLVLPEALFPISELPVLVEAAKRIRFRDHLGAIHVGLSGAENDSHLVSTERARATVRALRAAGVAAEELDAFDNWLGDHDNGLWNLAAFIARDENDDVRVCLHAKAARSKYEFKSYAEGAMTEADTGWVITLSSDARGAQDVNLHLVICSDLTVLQPLTLAAEARNSAKRRFAGSIDLVSAPAATPTSKGRWRQAFTETLSQAARGYPQSHKHATFVLANYSDVVPGQPAGLSGVLVPRRATMTIRGFRRVALMHVPSDKKHLLSTPPDHGTPIPFDADRDDDWLPLDALDERFDPKKGFHASWLTFGTLVLLERANADPPTRLACLSVELARLRPLADTPGASAARVVDVVVTEAR